MPKERTKKATRKVDRLLGRQAEQTARGVAKTFEWTHSLESPTPDRMDGKSTKQPRLPRTRE